MKLSLDFESYSELDLKEVGTYVYAANAEILLAAFAIDDEPVEVWDATSEPMPAKLRDALLKVQSDPTSELIAHNGAFDKAILNACLPALAPPLERWRCSMAQALSHALPAGLGELCKVLKVPEDQAKLKEERKLVMLFCKPQAANRKVRRATRETHPAEWERFKKYAANDVVAMRECVARMPRWNWDASAIAEWHCDQRINERGFQVDTELTAAGALAATTEKARIGVRFRELTRDLVDRPSLRADFLKFLNSTYGLGIDNTRSETFQHLLKTRDLPADCAELLRLAIASNKTSTAKYAALAPATSNDGRFRGGLQFAGASRTRRWAGRIFQPQNLPSRGLPKAEQIAEYIDALKLGVHTDFFEPGELMRFGAAALRGVVIPRPSMRLAVADLSNIEGRMLAWLAGEQWKLQAFQGFDAGTGPDLYNITAASIIGGDPYRVSKTNRNVFGKVPDLSCIAEGQLVTTDRGEIPIEQVTVEMRIWDGLAFVHHDGVIYQGTKHVIEYDGLTATPDHLVFIDGEEREVPLLDAVRNGSRLVQPRAGRAAVRLGVDPDRREALQPRLAGGPGVRALHGLCDGEVDRAGQPDARSLQGVSAVLATEGGHARMAAAPADGGQAAVREPQRARVGELRRPGAQVRVHVGVGCGAMGDREHVAVATGEGHRPNGQHPRVCAGESPVGHAVREQLQQANEHAGNLVGVRSDQVALLGEPGTAPAQGGNDAGADPCRCAPGGRGKTQELARDKGTARTYDILNCGPRNRFVVSGRLVHNCGYQGGVAGFQTFARAYGVKMADYWTTIRENIDARHISKAHENLEKWGHKQLADLEIDASEWLASETCKLAWRARHPATERFWYALGGAAKDAIREWGQVFTAGQWLKVRGVTHRGQRWLVIALPSGRYLTYFDPQLTDDGSITYMGDAAEQGSTNRMWVRVHTHGGKLTGNCLGDDTKVYTKRGVIQLYDVKPRDWVWDGEEWVQTDGVCPMGVKPTGRWLGVVMTADHRVLVRKDRWRAVSKLTPDEAASALRTGSRSVGIPRRKIPEVDTWSAEGLNRPVYDLINCGPRNRFTVLSDHGPVVVHNCCQTIARDQLMSALPVAEARGFTPVLTVHDEVIAEFPADGSLSYRDLVSIMATNQPWNPGLPLAAAGFDTMRYCKD